MATQLPEFALHHGDAFAWLRTLDDASVDLIVTDPPYASLEKHRAVGTTTRLARSRASSNPWFTTIANEELPGMFASLFRVLRDDRHCYLFCDAETAFLAKPAGESAGFRFWKPLVWDKKKIGMGYHYRARYEFILFFEKGKRRLNDLGIPDILEAPRVYNGYPTEKPVELSAVLIGQSSQPGEVVIDPFMGSGSVGVAAVRCKRHFLGSDVEADAVQLAQTRLVEAGAARNERRIPLRRQLPLIELDAARARRSTAR